MRGNPTRRVAVWPNAKPHRPCVPRLTLPTPKPLESPEHPLPIQPADIRFDEQGNAHSETFNDIYFNPNDAAGKTNHLFHRATRFDAQLEQLANGQHLIVGELGFGLGLNFLVTWSKFLQRTTAPSRLHYVGLDIAPPSHHQLHQALGRFPAWSELVEQLLGEWPGRVAGVHRLRLDRCDLTLHLGDISEMLPGVEAQADAWFLDGFAPEKNPAMWSASVAQHLLARTRSGGTVGSFTAAGHVRRALADAGFTVDRLPGDPFKRHILAAEKPVLNKANQTAAPPLPQKTIAVVGAGWAGLSVAEELHRRGHAVVVLDAEAPGAGASGNRQAICAPVLDAAPSPRQDFYRSAFVLAARQHDRCGVLRKPGTQKTAAALAQAAEVFGDLDGYLQWRDPSVDQSKDTPRQAGGLWMPQAGVARFDEFVQRITAGLPGSAQRWPFALRDLKRSGEQWRLTSDLGESLDVDAVVLACGAAVTRFAPAATWPLRSIRGQVTHVHATPTSEASRHAVVGEAYLCPAHDGGHSVGATFDPDDPDPQVRDADHEDNRRRASLTDAAWADAMDWNQPTGRVGWRCNTPDYLPMIGPVPDLPRCETYFAELPGNAVPTTHSWPVHPNLYAITALGSHGVISSALAASLIADRLDNTPPPCSANAAETVHPARFLTRAAKRRHPPAYLALEAD